MKKITLVLVALIAGTFAMQLNAQSDNDFNYNVEPVNFDGWNDLNIAHPVHIWGYYEHPYGQSSYIEYLVDEATGWTSVDVTLTSGEEFDFSIDIYFDPEMMTTHTLNLRLNDGLDNHTDMNGLTLTDVRSYEVSGIEDRVYNGQPQQFSVTVNGETSTYVGGTNPGTYTYTIEGVYEENTIGVMDVEYTISKGQAQIEVIVPEDVAYDGEAHGATVNVIAGDGDVTVTYVNAATGEESNEAPSAIGVYVVVVEVADGEYYNGIEATSYGQFEIYDQVTGIHEINVDQKGNNEWYTIDGRRVVAPTAPGLYIHNGKKYIVN